RYSSCRHSGQLHGSGYTGGLRPRPPRLACRRARKRRTIMSKSPLFPTSLLGSLPRPSFVLDLVNERPPLSAERYEHEMDAAVRYAVTMQEHAGLDVVSDGEWRARAYLG